MEPVFGNHLGMVINNNDPEGRKRVQVFIPYLTNTLFAGWNNNLIDKTFKTIVELRDYGVLDRLKQTLPWAEYAAPMFGGATSATSNSSTGKVQVNNTGETTFAPGEYAVYTKTEPIPPNSTALLTDSKTGDPAKQLPENSNVSSNNLPYPNSLSDVPDNVLKYIYSLGASETGFPATASVSEKELAIINRESYGSALLNGIDPNNVTYNKYVAAEYNKLQSINNNPKANLIAAQQKFGDFGPFQYNSDNSRDAASKGITLNYNAPANEQALALAQYMYYKDDNLYNNLTNDSWNRKYDGKFGGLWGLNREGDVINKRLTAYDKLNKDQMIANLNAISSDTALSSSASSLVNNQESKTNIIKSEDVRNNQAAKFNNKFTSASGSPNGTVSVPNESAKVWVFFYGGDIQRPVYFASAIEGST